MLLYDRILWVYGGMTEGQLGKKVHLDSGTLTPVLKRLDKAGYVNRIRPENNERKLFLSLTKEGEELKEKAKKIPKRCKAAFRFRRMIYLYCEIC